MRGTGSSPVSAGEALPVATLIHLGRGQTRATASAALQLTGSAKRRQVPKIAQNLDMDLRLEGAGSAPRRWHGNRSDCMHNDNAPCMRYPMTPRHRTLSALGLLAALSLVTGKAMAADDTIKVGILHSLSGTMAISETT